jgi:membrane protease YdiL (CAAX protease family)
MTAMAAFSSAPALEPNGAREAADVNAVAGQLWMHALVQIVMTQACYVLLQAVSGATRRDLGLSASRDEVRRDVLIGATAFAASLVPIYSIMLVLNALFKPTEGHPLIEQLINDHSLNMMAASAFAAVVAAPLYEETAFRLVLQGWLEKIATPAPRQSGPSSARLTTANAAERDAGEPAAKLSIDVAPLADGPGAQPVDDHVAAQQPGWPPILVSGVLFGLAHWGHGVSPLPLVLLGVVLGYVYQRTHRILPCMVCHFLFNGFTFLMLAVEFAARSE